ncbi:MAG: hypothetical protein ACPGUV_13300 [Polyangiales bacterium]
MALVSHADLHHYFQQRLRDAAAGHALGLSDQTELYLVHMLARLGLRFHPPEDDAPFVLRLQQALREEALNERLRQLGHMGDEALSTSGLFAAHLQHRGVTVDYMSHIGGQAYQHAAQLASQSMAQGLRQKAAVWQQLAERFVPIVQVLQAVQEPNVLRTPQAIVREYDRWRRLSCHQSAARLRAAGITLDPKATLH